MTNYLPFFRLNQCALTHGTVSVERKKPRVGTSEFINGFDKFAIKKNTTTTK